MQMFETIEIQINKLTRANYEIWLKKIETYITAMGLSKVLNQEFENNEVPENQKESQKEVLRILYLGIDSNDYVLIKDSKTVKEALKCLKDYYRTKEDIFYVFQDFTKIKFNPNDGIEKYFSEIQKIRARSIVASGDKHTNLISDKVLIEKLSQDMPNFMDEIMRAIRLKFDNQKVLKYEETVDTLINAYNDLKQPFFKKNEAVYNRKKCSYCFKFGHLRKDCRFVNN